MSPLPDLLFRSPAVFPASRRSRVWAVGGLLASLAAAGPLASQSPRAQAPPVLPGAPLTADTAGLSLDRVFLRLASHNSQLAAARAAVDVAAARVPIATAIPDPRVQLGAMNRDLPSLRPMETLGMDQLQVMQMLPLAGKRGNAERVAEARVSSARARADARWWDARRDAAIAFYDLWALERQLTVTRETQALLAQAADAAAAMYRVGQGRQADVLRAQMEITRMAEDVIRMRSMRATLAARLGAWLDLDVDADTLVLRIPRLDSVPDSLARGATATRPMLVAGRHEAVAAAESETLARRERWPDLEFGVQLARRPPSAAPAGMGGSADWMTSAMIGASLPLFGRTGAMRAEASAMRTMAEADVRAMEVEGRSLLREATAMLRQSRALRALYAGTLLPQAIAARDAATAAYRSGNVDFMTLLEAHMTTNRIRQEGYALRASEGKAIAELEMLTGRTLVNAASRLMIEEELR